MCFTNPDASFGAQLYGIIVIGIFTFVVSIAVFYIISITIGLRVSEEDEAKGLDSSELGMDAYPEFSKSSNIAS